MYSIVKPFKKGMIINWYSSIASIPSGWVLCNGDNDSPDMDGRFLKGAGVINAVGNSKEQTTHTHTFTANDHEHYIPDGEGIASGSGLIDETSTATTSGATGAANSDPRNRSLCFIMKL